jgi:uncharacterized protein YuzE
MGFQPYAEYSASADAVYIYLSSGKSARTRHLDDLRMIDYDSLGSVIGVELLGVSAGIDLNGVPEGGTIERLLKELQLRSPT